MPDSLMTWAPLFADEASPVARHDPGDEITDEELTALALAADPDEPLGADAVPLSFDGTNRPGLLPAWYMPPVMAGRARGWRVPVVYLLVGSFLLIDAFGLCMTYGVLTAA